MHDKAIAAQLAAAQSTVADGQLESGDTSTRPGNFLRAVEENPGTAKPWNGTDNTAPEPRPKHGPEKGHDYGTGD